MCLRNVKWIWIQETHEILYVQFSYIQQPAVINVITVTYQY